MKSSKKGVLIVFLVAVGLFGYSQYASASQIGATITQSSLLEENGSNSKFNVELEFDNPSFLMLTAGETEFFVSANNQNIGKGTLEAFTLPALGKTNVKGTFITNTSIDYSDAPEVKISGVTTYDMIFTSIDVPFVYYPSEEQAREFIHQQ